MSQQQAHQQRNDDEQEPEPTPSEADANLRKEKVVEFDELIDEIDAIIEETGVVEYIQKGGQ